MIRKAVESDIPVCVEMTRDFCKINGYQDHIPFDEETVKEWMAVGIQQGMLSVAVKDNEVVGFVLGVISPSIVNKDILVGCELAWWMQPKHRGGRLGIQLLKHIEVSAKENGAKIWSMMCLEALEPDKVERMYMKLGYKKSERTSIKVFQENN